MADVIDDLKIQLDASTQSADAKLDKFINKMLRLHQPFKDFPSGLRPPILAGLLLE